MKARVYITSRKEKMSNGEEALFEGPRIYATNWDNAVYALSQVCPDCWIEGVLLEESEARKLETNSN